LIYGTASISKVVQPTIEFVRYRPNAYFTKEEALNPYYGKEIKDREKKIKGEIFERLTNVYGNIFDKDEIKFLDTAVNILPKFKDKETEETIKIGKKTAGRKAYDWAKEKCNDVDFVLVIGDSGSDKDMKEGIEANNVHFCYVGGEPLPEVIAPNEDIILEKGPSGVIKMLELLKEKLSCKESLIKRTTP